MRNIRNWLKFFFYLLASLLTIQIALFYKWNWLCTNIEPHQNVYKLCNMYHEGTADGLLCSSLCDTKEVTSLTCYTRHVNKFAVFGATWVDEKIVFKSVDSDVPSLHWYDNGVLKYPSEKEFLATLRALSKNMLNTSVPSDILIKLAYLKPQRQDIPVNERRTEMDNIWTLVQDNEYLLTSTYWERGVFPRILGTCGPYFAVEYVEPLTESFSLLFDMDTRENWETNLKNSVLLMELLEELDSNFKEPLYICDMKLRDFGLTATENGRLKVLDLDTVYPKSIVSSFIKDIGRCTRDEDCKFIDCRGRCDVEKSKCNNVVTNNNLQIVCEKLFLGWRMSNTILIPGLLLSKFAPDELMAVLRQCANPENEENKIPRGAAGEDTRKRLYSILVEIEQSLNTDVL